MKPLFALHTVNHAILIDQRQNLLVLHKLACISMDVANMAGLTIKGII